MDKLKPCPFCGGKAIITVLQHRFTDLYFCSCEKCHISQTSGEYTFRQEAINAWNKRSNDAPVSLREAEKLICENRERLMTPRCEGERGMEGE